MPDFFFIRQRKKESVQESKNLWHAYFFTKEVTDMYEVVKTVNGHDIYRMKGTRGVYHVRLNEHSRVTFKTIKAADEYCSKL